MIKTKVIAITFICCNFLLSSCVNNTNINTSLGKIQQDNLAFVDDNVENKPLITPDQAEEFKQDYLMHYFSPWEVPFLFHTVDEIKTFEVIAVQKFINNPAWGENQELQTSAWYEAIQDNMDLSNFPNTSRKAIITHQTDLRILPTIHPSFGNSRIAGQGYPFDNLQASRLRENLSIYILQTTKDGAWKFVIAPDNVFGWVHSDDIAYVDSIFVKRWEKSVFIVPTQDNISLLGKNHEFYVLARLGELYPMTGESKNNYQILVAVQDADGNAVAKPSTISIEDAVRFPLLLTQKNVATLANHLLGVPYGWGGMYGDRDCSATTKALFSPFGIWLPRNSTDQAQVGTFISLKGLSDEQKIQMIREHGIPFVTLLWIPGHIMLYIGSDQNGNLYAFHSPWGLHTHTVITHAAGRAVIGRSVITPINFGNHYLNVNRSFLKAIQGIVILI